MESSQQIASIITGRPLSFRIGRKPLCLYPVTFAKTFMLAPYIEELGVDTRLLGVSPGTEVLRLAAAKRDTCASILAVHATPNTARDFFDTRSFAVRRNCFRKLSSRDMASLLLYVLSWDDSQQVMTALGMDKERQRLEKVIRLKSKSDSTTLAFGGKSVFGSFIAPLKEMGYTDDEILYERGYTYLRLMLADKPVSVFLTEEERSRLSNDIITPLYDADSPSAAAGLSTWLAGRGLRLQR